jgi:hypothetical protein
LIRDMINLLEILILYIGIVLICSKKNLGFNQLSLLACRFEGLQNVFNGIYEKLGDCAFCIKKLA